MRDFDEFVRSLGDRDRVDIIKALIARDATAHKIARGPGRKARRGTSGRDRAEEARGERDRLGRIICFVRFRSPATGSTAADLALCDFLAQSLAAKGQWSGEIPG